jgi:hypothetical protein
MVQSLKIPLCKTCGYAEASIVHRVGDPDTHPFEHQGDFLDYVSSIGLKVAAPRARSANPVDHPPHYCSHPSGIECIRVAEHMSFCLGNAMKYLWRAGEKGKQVEDLQKAIWYIEREILRIQGQKTDELVQENLKPEEWSAAGVCHYCKGTRSVGHKTQCAWGPWQR